MIISIVTGSVDETSTWNVVVEAFAARWSRHRATAVHVGVAVGARHVGLAVAAHRFFRVDAVLSAVSFSLVAAHAVILLAGVHVHIGTTAPQISAGALARVLSMNFVQVRGAASIHVARPSLDAILTVLRQVRRARSCQILRTAAELYKVGAVADAGATLPSATSTRAGQVLLASFLTRSSTALAQNGRSDDGQIAIH